MPNGNKVTVQKELGLRGLIDYMVDDRDLANTDGEIDNVGGTPLSAVAVQDSETSGEGNSDGQGTVTPTGGVAPYTYLWSSSSETTQTATALSSGIQSVTVTDAIEDSVVASVTIYDGVIGPE